VIAGALKSRISDFHAEHRRLPGQAEADALSAGMPASTYVQSVAYDAGRRMIVITMGGPFPGKRVALHVEERAASLAWICRSIDLEKRHLPAGCRQ